MPVFKVDASNGLNKVNVDTSFKNLNNVKSCTLLTLNSSTLNLDHKINNINLKKKNHFNMEHAEHAKYTVRIGSHSLPTNYSLPLILYTDPANYSHHFQSL
jgi:hypothetical protein